ncbi:hypothetical protein SAMN05660909_02990 [Chitinophaga terrae (ex Kim and Jung 2007)]|uniref:Uncharacterized protein n=1 Tax=Chitinophaga terrae (ex Kim and Jung 2007) TaxID=408074 RepID=A0A1H4D5Z7_9BACT|nr:hypothetical protein SAMN05660909_02990 [Chitinophaga terrae (ex Kim and Jung 2007)]
MSYIYPGRVKQLDGSYGFISCKDRECRLSFWAEAETGNGKAKWLFAVSPSRFLFLQYYYSLLKLLTGFANAAFTAWKLTVKIAMRVTSNAA